MRDTAPADSELGREYSRGAVLTTAPRISRLNMRYKEIFIFLSATEPYISCPAAAVSRLCVGFEVEVGITPRSRDFGGVGPRAGR